MFTFLRSNLLQGNSTILYVSFLIITVFLVSWRKTNKPIKSSSQFFFYISIDKLKPITFPVNAYMVIVSCRIFEYTLRFRRWFITLLSNTSCYCFKWINIKEYILFFILHIMRIYQASMSVDTFDGLLCNQSLFHRSIFIYLHMFTFILFFRSWIYHWRVRISSFNRYLWVHSVLIITI